MGRGECNVGKESVKQEVACNVGRGECNMGEESVKWGSNM